MNRILRSALVFLLLGLCSLSLSAQDSPELSVSPSKATMLVGETRTFRAVGKDGRIRHNVQWSVSPDRAAAIKSNSDEVTVEAREASPSVLLTASAEGDSSEASIEIRPVGDMPAGTPIWSVSPTPGCKATKMIQAVPSANGPDLYVQETCPDGTMLRALTADGRELWRRLLGSGAAPSDLAVPIAKGALIGFLPNGITSGVAAKSAEPSGEHINLHSTSVCDSISAGMNRDEADKTLAERKLQVDVKKRQDPTWIIEEEGFQCTISFDAKTGTVIKKKKTVVTD